MFGGPRDSEWTHIRVVGDRAEAAKYLPAARVLLGAAKAAVKTGVIKLSVLRRRYNNGVEMYAEMAMGIPRITIKIPPPRRAVDEDVKLDGFVVWPRDATAPDGPFADGQPATYPQQVLSPPSTRTRQSEWWTFAYDRFLNFWEAIRARKETYKARGNRDLLPDGLRYYGNHHWRGKNGVVVSWHGPESGAIVNGVRPHYFQPDGAGGMTATFAPGYQHGAHVFHFGKVLVNVTQWATDYERVGGACVREDEEGDLWLYVAQFKLPDFRELAVYRYRLIRGLAWPGFDEVQVDAGNPEARELVWAAPLPVSSTDYTGAYAHPARFSASGKKLLVYVPGREPYIWFPPPPGEAIVLPYSVFADSDARIEFDVDTGASTVTPLTIPVDAFGSSPIAGDYRGEDLVEFRAGGSSVLAGVNFGVPFELGAYLIGERSVPMQVRTESGAFIRRDIVRLNPADGLALLLRTEFPNIGAPGNLRSPFLELWSDDGGLLREWPCPQINFSATAYGAALGYDANLLPHHPLLGRGMGFKRDRTLNNLQPTYSASAWLRLVIDPLWPVLTGRYVYRGHFAELVFNPYRPWGVVNLRDTEEGFFLPAFAYFFDPSGDGIVGFENRSPRPDGGFHGGDVIDNTGYTITRALLKHEGTIFLSCFKPGAPDESIVEFISSGDPQKLTGLSGANLRLHPASLLGAPIFKTE